MLYELTTKQYFSMLKRKIDMKYSTNANSIDEAVENLYPHLQYKKWTKEMIKKELTK